MDVKTRYSIISFVILLKLHRRNSCIYSHDNQKELAKNLGISYNSYRKYKKICIERGYLKKMGSHLQAIKIRTIIPDLGPDTDKYQRYFTEFKYEKISFKAVYNQLVKSFILLNYERQEFKINQSKNILEKIDNNRKLMTKSQKGKITTFIKKAAKSGLSFDEYRQCILSRIEKGIISGKNHVANLINYSSTSGLRWLRKLEKEGIIDRKVKKLYLDGSLSHELFDYYKAKYKHSFVIPCRYLNKFMVILGSSICLKEPIIIR